MKRKRYPDDGPMDPWPPKMVDDAIHAVTVYFSVLETPIDESDLIDVSRDAYAVRVRAMTMWLLKTEGHLSYPAIGKRLKRDHSSVLKLVRKIHDLADPEDLADLLEYVNHAISRKAASRRALLDATLDEVKV